MRTRAPGSWARSASRCQLEGKESSREPAEAESLKVSLEPPEPPPSRKPTTGASTAAASATGRKSPAARGARWRPRVAAARGDVEAASARRPAGPAARRRAPARRGSRKTGRPGVARRAVRGARVGVPAAGRRRVASAEARGRALRRGAERPPRLQHQLPSRRRALPGLLRHPPGDHLVHRRGEVGAHLRQPRRRLGEVREQHPLFGGPHERDLAGEALAEHGRERVHVASGAVAPLAAGLLGGDVVDRAHELTGFGHARRRRGPWSARSPPGRRGRRRRRARSEA